MERMLIKHLSGSKANQVEEFALKHHNELVFGREGNSTVKYDPDRDDLVGREHARITPDPSNPNGFLLTDLNSKNGTFLNSQRISGTVQLNIGDNVQFGPGGPEFTFDVEPRPDNYAKTTRQADAGHTATPATRTIDSTAMAATAGMGGKTTVGKATVERMISQTATETRKSQGKKYGIIGGIAAVLVLMLFGAVVAGGYWYYSTREDVMNAALANKTAEIQKGIDADKAGADMSAAAIAEKVGKTVVYIQGSWQLVNKTSKGQVYHSFVPNSKEVLGRMLKKDLGKGRIVETGGDLIPAYLGGQEGYEPMLDEEKGDANQPLGSGGGSCSGVIVTADGYVLTNRHCTSPWKAPYSFPQNYPRGVVLGQDGSILAAGVDPPRDWIPDNTKNVPRQYQGQFDGVRNITVMLPGTDNPINATWIIDSPRADVGMLKISIPGSLPKAELHDAWDSLRKGDGLVIMGYPATAPNVYTPIKSADIFNKETKFTIIPDPTVSVTSVGNIVKNSAPNDLANVRISPTDGDSIRYAGSLTYGGNSGGPVFDMQGRVIGLHFAGVSGGGGNFTGNAVPIRYGMQLFPGGQ